MKQNYTNIIKRLKDSRLIYRGYRTGKRIQVTARWAICGKYKILSKAINEPDNIWIEAYVDAWCRYNGQYIQGFGPRIKNGNWGDDINKYLIEKMTEKQVMFAPFSTLLLNKPHYLCIGSILDDRNLDGASILGTGFRKPDSHWEGKPREIYCVRGSLTRERLQRGGY